MQKKAIPYERFVKVWTTAATLAEAAKELGVTTGACTTVAARLRKQGVKLRRFERAQRIDAKKLNKLVGAK